MFKWKMSTSIKKQGLNRAVSHNLADTTKRLLQTESCCRKNIRKMLNHVIAGTIFMISNKNEPVNKFYIIKYRQLSRLKTTDTQKHRSIEVCSANHKLSARWLKWSAN